MDNKTQSLLQDLKNEFQIEFEQKEIEYCQVFTKKNHATIYYNPKLIDSIKVEE